LDQRGQRKFFFVRGLLEEFGHKLPFPHARYIGDSIFELRFGAGEGSVRVLYFFFERNKIIFTNGFFKKTDKTPVKLKQLALERKRLFLAGIKGVD
jgi:phage-related protein